MFTASLAENFNEANREIEQHQREEELEAISSLGFEMSRTRVLP